MLRPGRGLPLLHYLLWVAGTATGLGTSWYTSLGTPPLSRTAQPVHRTAARERPEELVGLQVPERCLEALQREGRDDPPPVTLFVRSSAAKPLSALYLSTLG